MEKETMRVECEEAGGLMWQHPCAQDRERAGVLHKNPEARRMTPVYTEEELKSLEELHTDTPTGSWITKIPQRRLKSKKKKKKCGPITFTKDYRWLR